MPESGGTVAVPGDFSQGNCIMKGRHGEREKGQEEIGQARGPAPTRPVIDGD